MDKQKPVPVSEGQISQYDKILQENIEAALPGLIKNVLHINVERIEELPDNVQHTKERKPDLLKKVTDDNGNIFILHIEFQTVNDTDMPYRMLEYLALLLRIYKLPVVQYVIFIGEGKITMPTMLVNGKSSFIYEIIAISSIDYKVFLQSDKPEEKMFAILGDFGKDNPETVIKRITTEIDNSVKSGLEKQRRKNQLRVLAQLRTLVSVILRRMQPVSSFFKVENDMFYIVGERMGEEKARREEKAVFVENLLAANKFTNSEIANYVGVTEDFVREIQKQKQSSSQ